MQLDFRRLFVISYLQVARDTLKPQSTFEAFYPFIVAAAEPQPGTTFDPTAIATRLRQSLGWPATRDFVELFVNDLARRQLIVSAGEGYCWTATAVAPEENQIREEIDHLRNAFLQFSDSLSPLLLAGLSADDRLHRLALTLLTNKLFTMAALDSYVSNGAEDDDQEAQSSDALSEENFNYIAARFIKHCKKLDGRAFNALLVLANLGVVTQLAQFFHRRTDSIEKAGSPLVILDGPFLLDLIGFAGSERQHDAQIIATLARNRNCKIAAFRHSISEAFDIVRAVTGNSPVNRFGHVAQAIRKQDVTLQTLSLFTSDALGFVRRLNILDEIIESKDKRIWANTEYFNQEESKQFFASMVGWRNAIAQQRDADSVTHVMRMRAGHVERSHWRSKVLMLSSNDNLARLARRFVLEKELINEDSAGPVIARQEFAAILWLAGDPKNKAEIASAQLLSAAQSVLARDRKFIERVREFADGVSGDRKEFVRAIVQQEISYEMLQDAALGDPKRINDKTIDTVVAGLIETGRKEERQVKQAEESRQLRRLKHEAEQAKLDVEKAKAATRSTQKEIADRLTRHGEALGVIGGLLDDAEERWSSVILPLRIAVMLTMLGFFGVALYLIAVFGFSASTEFGWTTLVIAILLGAVVIASEHLKSNFVKIATGISDQWAMNLATPKAERFKTRLPPNAPKIVLAIESGNMRITNREAILSAISFTYVEKPVDVDEVGKDDLFT